jgi:hypothetical protein
MLGRPTAQPYGSANPEPCAAKYGAMICIEFGFDFTGTTTLARHMKNQGPVHTLRELKRMRNTVADA